MSGYYCENCGEPISEDDVHWYDGNTYCDDCFHDRYTYCERCDEAIDRDYCYYDNDGYAYCSSCHEDDIDPNAPDNPQVNDSEREQIINLSKCWLRGERAKTLIRINRNDHHLEEIQEEVGLTNSPIYLYGLYDRDDYQIKASLNIMEKLEESLKSTKLDVTIEEDIGYNRLGISRTLREEINGIVKSFV